MRVDRFGNLITNITRPDMEATGADLEVWVGSRRIDGVSRTFSDVPAGQPCAVVGSTGRLELCVNGDRAADRFGVGRGAEVRVRSRASA